MDFEDNSETKYAPPLYKKWFKLKDKGGFLSISPWTSGGKWVIDIGSVDASNKPISNTKCFVDSNKFNAYLNAVIIGRGEVVYPARPGLATPESFVAYGGSERNGDIVSRVFKVHWWGDDTTNNPHAFAWKSGHFKGNKTSTGAITPDLKSPISINMIKVTLEEMHEINTILSTYNTASTCASLMDTLNSN